MDRFFNVRGGFGIACVSLTILRSKMAALGTQKPFRGLYGFHQLRTLPSAQDPVRSGSHAAFRQIPFFRCADPFCGNLRDRRSIVEFSGETVFEPEAVLRSPTRSSARKGP